MTGLPRETEPGLFLVHGTEQAVNEATAVVMASVGDLAVILRHCPFCEQNSPPGLFEDGRCPNCRRAYDKPPEVLDDHGA